MKLSPEKRNKLILVGLATLGCLALLWYFLCGAQEARLRDIKSKIDAATEKGRQMHQAITGADKIETELKTSQQALDSIEQEMASGDLYSWFYSTIKNFKANYPVEIPQFSNVEVGPCTLMPQFPYKQVKISVAGTAYFHDFGRFLADFENRYPHIRVEALQLQPGGGTADTEREKLTFHMNIVALVKSDSTSAEK